MNLSSWASYLVRFKDLLRPEGVSPLAEKDENVETVRGEDPARMALSTITATVPNLVFEGYGDWYSYQDEWVLRNLGQVLTLEEENEILYRLDQGSPDALRELLSYIADERLSAWRTAAAEEFAQFDDDADPEILRGLANTANWEASRTPGTYYYTHVDGRYLFSDLSEAPIDDWETLPVREQLATENARAWGDSGWYCTPTGEPDLYGGAFVFAPDPDGSWMTQEDAEAQLQEPPVEHRFDPVESVRGYQGWFQGYDTHEEVWKYAQANGSQVPSDDAVWIAVDTPSTDGTEYFAGPGYSDDGWVSYEPESQAEMATETSPSVDQEVLAMANQVRQEVVDQAFRLLKEGHPELTDSEAEQLAVAATSSALLTR
jgi:hypothetical protein